MLNSTGIRQIRGVERNPLIAKLSALFKTFNSRCAFTLAEVLITLGIIGVVAAMVIPSIIGKYQEIYTVTRVRKTYAILNEALRLSTIDNGEPGGWNIPRTQTTAAHARKIALYIVPYLKTIKDCGTKPGCLGYDKKIKILNGADHVPDYENDDIYYKFILLDGAYVWLRAPNTGDSRPDSKMQLFTDINGAKPPNTVAKDVFFFTLAGDELIPNGRGTNHADCQKRGAGLSCTDFIIQNGNMKYLKK